MGDGRGLLRGLPHYADQVILNWLLKGYVPGRGWNYKYVRY